MKLSEFDYNLPSNLIATKPMKPRDRSRLLILEKKTGNIEHKNFFNIINYLNKGDVLVLNNSRVMPARLLGKKAVTGGKLEIFLLKKKSNSKPEIWECLVGGKGARAGMMVEFDEDLVGEILKNNNNGTWEIRFGKQGRDFLGVIDRIGQMPLPPYIIANRKPQAVNSKFDKIYYQTVFADDKKVGSVAAPTAGLHFTSELLQKIREKGVMIEYITLHVGLGTFAPVKVDDITKHKMHSEFVEISKSTADRIIKAKKEKRRIITVGTTSTRALEAFFSNSKSQISNSKFFSGWVDIFIYPGYEFKVVDAMITNFHLPKSTLLMLVSALAGTDYVKKAYREAIEKKYRFYSYGDAMLIL